MNNFKVLAIMTSYNEEDIIVPSIMKLVQQGIDVYLIDNWSNDGTYDLARELKNAGLIELERFPHEGEQKYFELGVLLQRVEEIASEQDANWFVHHDVDEVRMSPWLGVNYREGLYRVDQAGYSCIDHLGITFQPVDNGFEPGSDFERYFQYFDLKRFRARYGKSVPHLKAWKNTGREISLAESGGHDVQFEGRHIYPLPFLLKHYPFRSQEHAWNKVFLDRRPRYNPVEKEAGWHVQYDGMQRDHNFVRPLHDVHFYNEESFISEWLHRMSPTDVE